MNPLRRELARGAPQAQDLLESVQDAERQQLLDVALLETVRAGDTADAVRWLIQNGADVNYATSETNVLEVATTFVDFPQLISLQIILASGIRKEQFPEAVMDCVEARVIVGAHQIGEDVPSQKALLQLLQAGFPVNFQGKNKNTPLHEAVRYYHKHLDFGQGSDLVPLLLQYGASPLLENENGETPLDLARRNGDLKTINLLEGYASSSR